MGKTVGKILKVVGTVAAIASIAVTAGASLGLSALAFGAISAGATIGASLMQKRPKAPRVSSDAAQRLNASIDPRTPRKGVFGVTAGRVSIR